LGKLVAALSRYSRRGANAAAGLTVSGFGCIAVFGRGTDDRPDDRGTGRRRYDPSRRHEPARLHR
jgi:hypothetical protein